MADPITQVVQSLGLVTAYGYAKSKGYTGTEEEFAEAAAAIGQGAATATAAAEAASDDAETATTAAGTATTAARNAENSATAALQYMNNAETAATNAGTAQTAAAGSATSAAASAQAAATSEYNAGVAAGASSDYALVSQDHSEDSEAWAVGTKNGTDVPATAEQYQNNAKYYAEQASGATGTATGAAQAAAASAVSAEAWATGGSGGTACATNNAQYWAEQAAISAATFVTDDTLSVSGTAADAAAVGTKISDLKNQISDIANSNVEHKGSDIEGWESGHNITNTGTYGTNTTFSASPTYIKIPEYVKRIRFTTGAFSGFVATYSKPQVTGGFIERLSISAGRSLEIDTTNVRYIRISISSTDITNAGTVSWTYLYEPENADRYFTTGNEKCNEIEANTDLDDITTPGNYYASSGSVASTLIHSPSQLAFRLLVVSTTQSNRIMQIALINSKTIGSKLKVRFLQDTWSDWDNITTVNYVNAIFDNAFELTSDTITIEANTDLNTLKTAGNYKATSAETVSTLLNKPADLTAACSIRVIHLTKTQRIEQVIFEQKNTAPIYRRFYDGTNWYAWRSLASEDEIIKESNTILTADNYTQYFPNALFADAKPNTIYGIYNSSLFADAPIGDEWIGTSDRSPTGGGMRGTLFTFTQAKSRDAVQSGLSQLFVGFRGPSFTPTLSYRIATASGGIYTWSKWSKFTQNGYVRASNMIVYGGSMELTFDDMNNMPKNSICQLDRNLNGSDAAHTLANHPAPGVSCVAMSVAFSYTAYHGQVQTIWTIDGRMYWRYGYTQNAGDYRWTPWRKVAIDIPDPPQVDGTYTLKCTVSNGTPAYTWVID